LFGLLVAGASVSAVLIVLPRLVRSYAISLAAARGIDLKTGAVHLGWSTIFLENSEVKLVGVDGLEVRFSSIRADVDLRLRLTRLVAVGGHIVTRDALALRGQLESWRAARAGTATEPKRTSPTIEIQLDDVDAATTSGERLSAANVRVVREGARTDVMVASLEATAGHLVLKGSDGHVSFDGSSAALQGVRLGTGDIVWVLAPKTEGSTLSAGPDSLPPSDLPLPPEAQPNAKGKKSSPRPKEVVTPLPTLLPDLHLLRATLESLIAVAAAKIPVGASFAVDALSIRLQKGEDELALGSGKFDLDRDENRIALNFSTSPLARATPLTLRAELPTGAGDIELSASGGPVPFGLLGMREGGLLHLMDVERTSFGGKGRIVLDDKGANLSFDVEGSVHGLSLREPRLARDAVRGMDLGVSARGLINDKGELRLDDAEASLGAAHGSLHGGLAQTPEHLAAAFDFDFPTSSCQALLTSVPTALIPTLSGARMDGTFSLRGRLAFDTQNLDAMAFDYDVSDHCRLVDVPSELDKGRFARSFSHVIYSKTGEREEETTGPGSSNWTDLDDISPYLQVAVLTTEDGAFFHHHGFNHTAIRHAVAANIKAHRFVRGASTITMQLAKNLFLSREKTLARKVEELVLADYLEQAFTKEEMMELYLNIIEFGPDIYGVTAAAEHYFGRRPNELNLAECFFLSSILPNPIAFHRAYDQGQLSDGWMRTIRAHMSIAMRTGLISQAELAEGLTETVTFHHPADPPQTPRPPVSTPSHPAASTDEWQELN
jgi:hypothetical protein